MVFPCLTSPGRVPETGRQELQSRIDASPKNQDEAVVAMEARPFAPRPLNDGSEWEVMGLEWEWESGKMVEKWWLNGDLMVI